MVNERPEYEHEWIDESRKVKEYPLKWRVWNWFPTYSGPRATQHGLLRYSFPAMRSHFFTRPTDAVMVKTFGHFGRTTYIYIIEKKIVDTTQYTTAHRTMVEFEW